MKKLEDFSKIILLGAGQAAEWIYSQTPDMEKRLIGVADLLDAKARKIDTFHNMTVDNLTAFRNVINGATDVAIVVAIGIWNIVPLVNRLFDEYELREDQVFVPNPYVSLRTFMRNEDTMKQERIPFSDCRYEHIRSLFQDDISINHYNMLVNAVPWDKDGDFYDIRWYPDIKDMYFMSEQYWDDSMFSKHGNEATVLDCGAYIGDSVLQICSTIPESDIFYYAFEPVTKYAEQMKNDRHLQGCCKRLEVMNIGVGNVNGQFCFNAGEDAEGGTFIGGENKENTEMLTVKRMDDVNMDIRGQLYIKMDIEGLELDALKGAENTIKKHRPALAICLYHKKNDLLEIPSYITSIVDDYVYYLRGGYHTILCAVPKEMM